MSKNYVTYESERDNNFINSFTKLSPEVQKLVINGDETYSIDPFISLEKYKYVKSLEELNDSLRPNETLVIEISDENLDKVSRDNIFTYTKPVKSEKKSNYEIGKKTYLVDYDFSLNGLSKEEQQSFVPSVLLKRNDGSYALRQICTITDSIEERRHEIKEGYGGYSDLYFEIKDKKVADQFYDDAYELIKTSSQSWAVVRAPKYTLSQSK